MAGRIRDEDIALVRERSAIDEVVGEYLQLRNAGGGSLKGLCPFHDEKTPSFNVTPARGLWYCFSCAEGGDVIKFVQKIDNLSFAEAVERLAARAGIELRYEQGGHVPGREHSQRRRLLEAHKAAAEFFAERLRAPAAAPARAFLAERGFELADAERFGAGTRPPSGRRSPGTCAAAGSPTHELLLGGLASQGRRGPVDRFRGRLIWPIRDLTGDVIAFGARKLTADDDGPKYLNTPETPLFKKSSVLYGADLAKREIAQRRQAVIVEGYTDVMACHLAGVPTAVATCGTSFGDGHIKILRRLLMDADRFQVGGHLHLRRRRGRAAGGAARVRPGGTVRHPDVRGGAAGRPRPVRSAAPAGRRGRPRPDRAAPARSSSSPSAVSSAKHNLDTNEGRLAALDAAAPIIGRIKDPALRDRYAVSLDRWLGMLDEEFVLARVRAARARGRRPARPRRPGAASAARRQRGAASGERGRPGRRPGQAARPPGRRPAREAARSGRRRAPATTRKRPGDAGWSGRRSSSRCSARRCAGPLSTPSRRALSRCPCTRAVLDLIAACGGVARRGQRPGVGGAAA